MVTLAVLRRDRREDSGAEVSGAAAAVRTLAVLLQAGARPGEAWRHLAESGEAVARRVTDRCAGGMDLIDAIGAERAAWAEVAAAWEVASTVGAPLADVLRSFADALQDAASVADDVRISLAEPVGTARLLLWMPFAGLLLGAVLGFDTIAAIVSPIGAVCVTTGIALVLVARRWTRALVRRSQPEPGTPGLHAELVAVALRGGVAIPRALQLVESAGIFSSAGAERTRAVLDLSRSAGVPAVELLLATAAQQRHGARVQGRLRAARLSSALLLPLGVCTLPAFLLLGVAPLMLSVLGTTPLPI